MNQSNTNFANITNQSQSAAKQLSQGIDEMLEEWKVEGINKSSPNARLDQRIAMYNTQLISELMDIVESQGKRIRLLEEQNRNTWKNLDALNTIVLDPLEPQIEIDESECEEDSAPSEDNRLTHAKH